MAKEFRARPSDLLGIGSNDEQQPRSDFAYAAYCLDQAAFTWGKFVESEIHEATKKCKTDKDAERKVRMVMHRIFNSETVPTDPPERKKMGSEAQMPSVPKGRFQDPAKRFGKG